jgi:hypothetical protein
MNGHLNNKNNEPRGLLPTTAPFSRNYYWIPNLYAMRKRNEEREYYAALGTMILITVISITLIIQLIFGVWN